MNAHNSMLWSYIRMRHPDSYDSIVNYYTQKLIVEAKHVYNFKNASIDVAEPLTGDEQ